MKRSELWAFEAVCSGSSRQIVNYLTRMIPSESIFRKYPSESISKTSNLSKILKPPSETIQIQKTYSENIFRKHIQNLSKYTQAWILHISIPTGLTEYSSSSTASLRFATLNLFESEDLSFWIRSFPLNISSGSYEIQDCNSLVRIFDSATNWIAFHQKTASFDQIPSESFEANRAGTPCPSPHQPRTDRAGTSYTEDPPTYDDGSSSNIVRRYIIRLWSATTTFSFPRGGSGGVPINKIEDDDSSGA